MRTLLMIGSSIVAMGSCKGPHDKSLPAQVERLEQVVQQAMAELDKVDMNKVQEIDSLLKIDLAFMERQNTDTLMREEAVFLASHFRALKKPLARILKSHGMLDRELRKTSVSLERLKHDMQHGLLTDEEEPAFHGQEELIVDDLNRNAHEVYELYNEIVQRWELEREEAHQIVNMHRTKTTNRTPWNGS